jgi:hypothetical protein
MTRIDIVDVRDRVMAHCERIMLPSPFTTGHAYRDEQECSWKVSDLPAYVVEEAGRGSEYDYADAGTSYDTRDQIRIILYLSHIKDESYKKDFDNVDLANRCKAAVIHYFAARPTLSLDYDGGLVERARIVRASSPHTGPTLGTNTKNRVVVFLMAVQFANYAPQDEE